MNRRGFIGAMAALAAGYVLDEATKSMDGYRLNNNFSSRYSRKWARKFPEHKDFFRQRELKS